MKTALARAYLTFATLILALLLIACDKKAADEPPPGVTLESKEGNFTVVLPDSFPPPEQSSKQVQTEVGDITMHLYTSSKSDGSAFIVSYNDYPMDAFVKETPKMMDDIRDGALGNMNAKLESQKDFTFDGGHPARTIDFSLSSEGRNGYGRLQYLIAKPRLYQVIFLALDDKKQRDDPTVERTFASFKLMK